MSLKIFRAKGSSPTKL